MRLVDTSMWIEWLTGSAIGKKFQREFHNAASIVVPTLVQFELYKWHLRERGEAEAERVLAFTMSGIVTPLDTATAIRAAEVSKQHGLHASDAIILATALVLGVRLLTCDAHFHNLPNVDYSPK